ncbi:uncharacterized protein HRG_07237 [Hirsutella rhossiliensis]|uniref:Uncharacterized protein n=1 Tax=Hirsutella rhossiliensis TaxID=111463 RepID=A0A9P8SGI6_9HYPO|nr:uncharacterized protein HRG_07237 [Hirsutella rhossiliensis]KAH0961159.1 hypothetical protein HRG_07237 [Hirsutella rhossiliensis]
MPRERSLSHRGSPRNQDLESQASYRRRCLTPFTTLARSPHDEILRVLRDMDRQRAEDRTAAVKLNPDLLQNAAAHSITETT